MKKLAILAVLVFSCLIFVAVMMNLPGDQKQSKIDFDPYLRYYSIKQKKPPKKIRLQRPSDWYYIQRAYPHPTIPEGKPLEAVKEAQIDRQEQLLNKSANDATAIWVQAGPTNVPGRITDITVNPNDTSMIFAASAAGGVFKSTDFGVTWTSIFDEAGSPSIGAIALDPTDPDIIYVGTGEANAASDNYEGNGIWKTTDGGLTWNNIGLPNSYHIARIVINPSNTDMIWVAVGGKHFGATNPERGVYRSTDGGANWSQQLYVNDSTGCVDIVYHPNSGKLFAAMWEKVRYPDLPSDFGGFGSGIHVSSDLGATWDKLDPTTSLGVGLPFIAEDVGRIGLAADPTSNNIYALYSSDIGEFRGVYQSTDAGINWSRLNDGGISDVFGSWNGGWYFGQIRCAIGSTINYLYVMGVEIYRSNMTGSTVGDSWQWVGSGVHVDHHAMYIDPNNENRVYLGNDGGVDVSTNAGNSWTQCYNMPSTQFYAITIDPSNPERLYGGAQDNGTNRTLTGNLGDWDHIFGGDGFYCLVDPNNSNTIFVEYQYGDLYKSTNLGSNWSYAQSGIGGSDRHNWCTPFVFDPNNSNIMYYGSNYLYRSIDQANSWNAISGDLTNGPHPRAGFGTITTISVSPQNPAVIYVGTDDGNVWVTQNTGSSWTKISGGTTGLPDRYVTRVAADPNIVGRVFVTFSGYKNSDHQPHIFMNDNYGTAAWQDISGNLPDAPINDVIVDPDEVFTLYAGTDVGVYVTSNPTTTFDGVWEPLGIDMPIIPVHDLDYHPATRKLVAGTHGRSMFATTLPCNDPLDDDNDGWGNSCDNCPQNSNADQADADFDGIGDVCDACTDTDGDGFGDPGYAANTCPEDNCPEYSNPDQADFNNNGIGDLCESLDPSWDVVNSDCISLAVSNIGNFGNQGSGLGNMGFGSADCDPSAFAYLYDGSPIVGYIDGNDTVINSALFGSYKYLAFSGYNPTVNTINFGDYDKYESGTFVTSDFKIGVEKIWYAPKASDSCNFIIQEMKVYSFDGNSHTGVMLGEAVDYDVPSDAQSNNTGSYNITKRVVMLQGYESNPGVDCQDNDNRFAALAYIGATLSDTCAIDTTADPYSAFTQSNVTYVYPTGNFVPGELWQLMHQTGYSSLPTATDQHLVMNFLDNVTVTTGDTVRVYAILATVMNGSANDMFTTVDKAKRWFDDHVRFNCSGATCCVGMRGNIDGDPDNIVDISDLVYMVDYQFRNGDAPPCLEEADIDEPSPANLIDIGDLVYMVDYQFRGGDAPPMCP